MANFDILFRYVRARNLQNVKEMEKIIKFVKQRIIEVLESQQEIPSSVTYRLSNTLDHKVHVILEVRASEINNLVEQVVIDRRNDVEDEQQFNETAPKPITALYNTMEEIPLDSDADNETVQPRIEMPQSGPSSHIEMFQSLPSPQKASRPKKMLRRMRQKIRSAMKIPCTGNETPEKPSLFRRVFNRICRR